MDSINNLIGSRFEAIIKEIYPELVYIEGKSPRIPDFEHPLFYAEAKVCFDQWDYKLRLKEYQIESFKSLVQTKPVIYILGFHDFNDSMIRLSGKSDSAKKRILDKNMDVSKIYIVDNNIIEALWDKKNAITGTSSIHDCPIREGHLRQIITDSKITKQLIDNNKISVVNVCDSAREFYNIPSDYMYSLPILNENKEILVGHIMPIYSQAIIDYFHK